MPASGNEENGVKPLSRRFSDYNAGVPIKKRRIPKFWPPSPPPNKQSSQTAEDGSGHAQGPLSTTSNVSASADLSATNKDMICEKVKESVITNVYAQHIISDHSNVQVEEPIPSINCGSLSDLTNKDIHMGNEDSSGFQQMTGNPGLRSKYTEYNAFCLGNDMYGKSTGDEKCKSETSGFPRNTDLSLGSKEYFSSDLVGETIEAQNLSKESIDDSISLDLSLSKGRCGSGVGSNKGGTHLPWDLNTTMDVLEGSVHPDQKINDAKDATGHLQVTDCPTKIVGADFPLGSQVIAENKQRINFQMSSFSAPLHADASTLSLGFKPAILQSYFHQECMSSSCQHDLADVSSTISLPRSVIQPGIGNVGSHNIVKRELVDEFVRQEVKVPEANHIKSLDCRKVKQNLVLQRGQKAESSKSHNMNSVFLKSVKSEPVNEGNNDGIDPVRKIVVEAEKQIQVPCNLIAQNSCHPEILARKTESSDILGVSNISTCTREHENRMDVCQQTCDTDLQNGSAEVILFSVNDSNVTKDAEKSDEKSIPDAESCRLEFANEPFLDSAVNCEAFRTEEEKMNISGDVLEEDCYCSDDYESDGDHTIAKAVGRGKTSGEDDFEDGEVRESAHCHTTGETMCEKRDVEYIFHGKTYDQAQECTENSLTDSSTVTSSSVNETIRNQIRKGNAIVDEEKSGTNKDVCLQESPAIDILNLGDNNKVATIESMNGPTSEETELSSGGVSDENQGLENTVHNRDDMVPSDLVKNSNLEHCRGETPVSDYVAKDSVSGGNCDWTIKSSTSIVASPGKTGCSSGSLVQSLEQERFPEPLFEAYRLHPRGRGEGYMARGRHLDETSRISRSNFMNGRGRISNRIHPVHSDWESEKGLAPNYYNNQSDFRFSGQKYAPAVTESEVNYNFEIVSDSPFVHSGWGVRKITSDEGPNLRHLPSRWRAPIRRNRPRGRGFHRLNRVPRNNSLGKCIDNDGSELAGMRNSLRFMRDCHNNNIDPRLMSTQPPFEGVDDDHFVLESRNFSAFHRKGRPQIRPNSPIRSRSRSPHPWPSPRRRSPDGFNGRSEMPRRRSPMYRMEEIRTSDLPFPHEIVSKRNGSPPYMVRSPNMRDNHGHPRSVMYNRNPPNRMIPKSRRFNTRERTDRSDYFGGPVHGRRFQEVADKDNGEETMLTEGQGLVRSFRPAFREQRYHD